MMFCNHKGNHDAKLCSFEVVAHDPPVLDSEQALIEKRAELKTAETNVQQIQAERRSIQAKLAETNAGYMADATDRRTKALMKIS